MAITRNNLGFSVVEEPLDDAWAEVVGTLNASRHHQVGPHRFDWLYRRNPDGEAVLWAIREEKTGRMVGFTVCLPRRVMVDGRVHLCWNGADFSILPRYRTLGLAIKLRRMAKEGIDAGRAAFLYAHPNERMAVVHQKVGHVPVGPMVRYAIPLKTAPYLRRKLPAWLAQPAGTLLDPVVHLCSRYRWHRRRHEIRWVSPARFGDHYDRLFEENATCARVVGVRDARYLNWRYAANPLYKTHAVEAWDDGRLRGYLLFIIQDRTAQIKDVFPPQDQAVVGDLVAAAIRQARKRGLQSASFTALDGNPLLAQLQRLGFRRRPDGSMMYAYAPEGSPLREVILEQRNWFLTVGDRDV